MKSVHPILMILLSKNKCHVKIIPVMKVFVIIVVLSSFFMQGKAVNTITPIDNRAGLCDNSVNCIRQDKYGFVWFATQNGLCRYDGIMFYTLRHNLYDPSSLSGNDVFKIETDGEGMWIATAKGVDYLSFATGEFTKCTVSDNKGNKNLLTARINSITVNEGHVILTDDKGRMYLKSKDNKEFTFTVIQQGVRTFSACKYKDGRLLAVGPEGVCLLSADGRRIIGRLKCNITTDVKTVAYFSRNTGLLYVGNGIGRQSSAYSIEGRTIRRSGAYVPDDLMDVADYGKGVAFGVDCGGLVICNDASERQTYTPNNSNISGDAVYSLFKDNDNNLWVGTYRTGVNKVTDNTEWWTVLNRRNGRLSHNIVTAVVPDGGRIYIGLDGGGLNIYNKNTGRTETIRSSNSNLPGDNIVSMVKDDKDIYMSVYTKGLVRMSAATGKMTVYHMPKSEKEPADNIWALCDDGRGNVWIGGPDVNVLEKATGKITVIPGLEGTDCSAMCMRGNYMWISSNHEGLYKVDIRTRKIVKRYSDDKGSEVRLPANDVKYVCVSHDGTVWISVESSGFYSIDEKKRALTRHDVNDGMTTNLVTSMTEDGNGNMWIGTDNGMFKREKGSGIFVRFDRGTDLPSYYTYNTAKYDYGIIYMGSVNGLVFFDPRRTESRREHEGVCFISLSLMNNEKKTFNLFGKKPREIRLEHDENFFTINFSVPESNSPGRIQFAYRLDGMESKWRNVSGTREATYTSVPPGEYKFYVKCTGSDGKWGKPSVLAITVAPPWYATALAKSAWLLLGLLAVGICIKIYLREMRIKQDMRIIEIEKNTQKKLNEAKLNFYTSITHELRTPVFLIAAQIEELLDEKQSVVKVPSTYLMAVYRSARKLNRLISHIIDFRKMEEGKIQLCLQHQDVVAFCDNLSEDYRTLCGQKDISFSLVCAEKSIMLDYDPEKLETIISNLVSNAFKYTKENGHVELIVEDSPDRVTFKVKDNGIGIIEKMRDTIFESFFRTERAEKQSGGDGLGLSFVKSLVELHEGRISVDSEVNVGSVFTFFIPKKKRDVEDVAATPQQAGKIKASLPDIPQTAGAGQQPEDTAMPSNPTATHSILIIDDERDTVALIERSLAHDFKVYKAYDGEKGMEIVRDKMPDLIICDIMMPKMNGLEFLDILKKDKTLKHIKIIIFTAKTSEEDMMAAFNNGADSYLMKPLSLKVLRKRIDRLIEQNDNAELTNSILKTNNTYNKEEQIFLLRCREIIENNISNENFNIEFLADKLAMSHSSLYKKVKAMTGMSLIEFINDYKIYKAVQMFKRGETNIDSVSTSCGFKDIKNFREMFKKKMNMTPKQFVMNL